MARSLWTLNNFSYTVYSSLLKLLAQVWKPTTTVYRIILYAVELYLTLLVQRDSNLFQHDT